MQVKDILKKVAINVQIILHVTNMWGRYPAEYKNTVDLHIKAPDIN